MSDCDECDDFCVYNMPMWIYDIIANDKELGAMFINKKTGKTIAEEQEKTIISEDIQDQEYIEYECLICHGSHRDEENTSKYAIQLPCNKSHTLCCNCYQSWYYDQDMKIRVKEKIPIDEIKERNGKKKRFRTVIKYKCVLCQELFGEYDENLKIIK